MERLTRHIATVSGIKDNIKTQWGAAGSIKQVHDVLNKIRKTFRVREFDLDFVIDILALRRISKDDWDKVLKTLNGSSMNVILTNLGPGPGDVKLKQIYEAHLKHTEGMI